MRQGKSRRFSDSAQASDHEHHKTEKTDKTLHAPEASGSALAGNCE